MKNTPHPTGENPEIIEEVQAAEAVENELKYTDKLVENKCQGVPNETFGLIEIFSACSLNNAGLPNKGSQELKNEGSQELKKPRIKGTSQELKKPRIKGTREAKN